MSSTVAPFGYRMVVATELLNSGDVYYARTGDRLVGTARAGHYAGYGLRYYRKLIDNKCVICNEDAVTTSNGIQVCASHIGSKTPQITPKRVDTSDLQAATDPEVYQEKALTAVIEATSALCRFSNYESRRSSPEDWIEVEI